jgi:translocation and assembly module TamB
VAVVLWWAAATESGTRWLVGRSLDFVPAEVELGPMSGTLWHGVRLEHGAYRDAEKAVSLLGVDLQADWSATTLGHVAVARLGIENLEFVSLADSPEPTGPVDIDVPALPVRISVASIDIAAADIDGTNARDIAIHGVDVDGLEARVGSASAGVDDIELQVAELGLELRDDVPLRTQFSWRSTDDAWSGEGTVSGSLRYLDLEHELFGDYPLATSGSVDLSDPASPTIDVVSTFGEWRYENWVATDGRVHLTGSLDAFESNVAVSVSDSEQLSASIHGDLAGNASGLASIDLTVDALDGSTRLAGSAQWSPSPAADLEITSAGLDIAPLVGELASRVDAELRVIASGAEEFSVEVRRLAGTYGGRALVATGTVTREGEEWRCRGCDAAIGDNRIRSDLTVMNGRLDGTVDVDAPSIGQLHPDMAGSLRAEGSLSGSVETPYLSGDLVGRDLAIQEWSIDSLSVETRSTTTERIEIAVEADGLAYGETAMGGGTLRATGGPDRLDLESRWSRDEIDIQSAAQLIIDDETITGRLLNATVIDGNRGAWTLDGPADIVVEPNRVFFEGATWTNEDARLRVGQVSSETDSLSAEVELSAAPLRWLDAITPPAVSFDGYVDALIDVQRDGEDWSGRFEWRQQETVVNIATADGDRFAVEVPTATASAGLGPEGAGLRARLEATSGTRVDIDASLDDPQLSGEFRFTNGDLVVPALNVPITSIDVKVQGRSSGELTVSGRANSGEGTLSITGEITDPISVSPRVNIEIQGENATVLDWPEYVLVASPDLSLSGAGEQFRIDGRVRLDRAEIEVNELPEGVAAPSDDVVVTGREQAARRAARLTGEMTIELGDAIRVRAFGLDTGLEGELRITLPEGREPQANGELQLVGGLFEMYGQRLEIARGTMLFSGALDDPFVDIRATRSIDASEGAILVGLDISGRGDELVSTIFSEPAMPESEALSYLVTGRPLGQAGGSGQLLSDAAFSLGLRQAAMITSQLGAAVGLDELALEGSGQDSAALVAGMQISTNLYARFRYRVFSNLGEFLLRYSLTESISVEVGAGEFQTIDVLYTIERE